MRPVLFDTSIYIKVLRSKEDAALRLREMAAGAPVWLSAVVLEELYTGAGAKGRKILQRLEHDFERARRVLVPNRSDWTQTGKALARLAAKCGYEQIGRGRLTNSTLIATSAGRLGITVITANARDFGKLEEFLLFGWRVEPVGAR